MFFINSTCHQFFFFYKRYIYYFWLIFPIFWDNFFYFVTTDFKPCEPMYGLIYNINYVRYEYTTMYHHSDQSPHAVYCRHQSKLFTLPRLTKWGIHKICEAQIKQHLQQYTILFSNFLKLDSSFPKNINMNFHIKGRISSLWKINHVIL